MIQLLYIGRIAHMNLYYNNSQTMQVFMLIVVSHLVHEKHLQYI